MPNLELIDLSHNFITHVRQGTFDKLQHLTELYFNSNPCYSGDAHDRTGVLNLIHEIQGKCPSKENSDTQSEDASIIGIDEQNREFLKNLVKKLNNMEVTIKDLLDAKSTDENSKLRAIYLKVDSNKDLIKEEFRSINNFNKKISDQEQEIKELTKKLEAEQAKSQNSIEAKDAKINDLHLEIAAEKVKNINNKLCENLLTEFNKIPKMLEIVKNSNNANIMATLNAVFSNNAKFDLMDVKMNENDSKLSKKMAEIELMLNSTRNLITVELPSINKTCATFNQKFDDLKCKEPIRLP